jgi:hypothetical protein
MFISGRRDTILFSRSKSYGREGEVMGGRESVFVLVFRGRETTGGRENALTQGK